MVMVSFAPSAVVVSAGAAELLSVPVFSDALGALVCVPVLGLAQPAKILAANPIPIIKLTDFLFICLPPGDKFYTLRHLWHITYSITDTNFTSNTEMIVTKIMMKNMTGVFKRFWA